MLVKSVFAQQLLLLPLQRRVPVRLAYDWKERCPSSAMRSIVRLLALRQSVGALVANWLQQRREFATLRGVR